MTSLVSYRLDIYNPAGTFLASVTSSGMIDLQYGLKENEPGVLEFALPMSFEKDNLQIEGLIDLVRFYAGQISIVGDTSWFIRKIELRQIDNGQEYIAVTAYSACDLLTRRIIAYPAGSTYAEKASVAWDDMLREIMRENYGADATDTTRNLSPWLTIQADASLGSTYTEALAWKQVSDALTGIIENVKSNGTYCAFDIVRLDIAQFEFQVFLNARGTDHSQSSVNPVIVSKEFHNLVSPNVEYDWQGERNYIYVAGQGQEANREVVEISDTPRLTLGPFNRREFLQDARQSSTTGALTSAGYAALEEFRPKIVFTGLITQTPGCIYGVHWQWGDIVTASWMNLSFDCHIDSVVVSIDQSGTEIVQGNLRSVQDV